MIDPDSIRIYVEGITDYNYLTAFKILFGLEGISFIPINGVGSTAEEMDGIIRKLLKIDKAPTILVDADNNGLLFSRRAEGSNIEVVLLSDISRDFRTIETLFSEEERDYFNLDDKSWNESSIFKYNIEVFSDEISEKTKENFRMVLDHLIRMFSNRWLPAAIAHQWLAFSLSCSTPIPCSNILDTIIWLALCPLSASFITISKASAYLGESPLSKSLANL